LAADITGEGGVDLLDFLGTGKANLVGIDDDDEVAAIDMGGEKRFALSAKQIRGVDSDGTEDLALGIDDVPLALDFFGFCGKGFHIRMVFFAFAGTSTAGRSMVGRILLRDPGARREGRESMRVVEDVKPFEAGNIGVPDGAGRGSFRAGFERGGSEPF
jgi:hypothetical protein